MQELKYKIGDKVRIHINNNSTINSYKDWTDSSLAECGWFEFKIIGIRSDASAQYDYVIYIPEKKHKWGFLANSRTFLGYKIDERYLDYYVLKINSNIIIKKRKCPECN